MGGEVSYPSLCDLAHRMHLHAKSTATIVRSKMFEVLYSDSKPKEKELVIKLIEGSKREEILNWMQNHPSFSLCEMSSRQLKSRARILCIRYYGILTKSELIRAIQNREEKDAKQA